MLACIFSISRPLSRGCPLQRQRILSSSEQSNAKFNANNLNDLVMTCGSSDQVSGINSTITFRGGTFKLPAVVSLWIPSSSSLLSYLSVQLTLNGLFQGWVYIAHPQLLTITYHYLAISSSNPAISTSYQMATQNYLPLPINTHHYPSLPTTTQQKDTTKHH